MLRFSLISQKWEKRGEDGNGERGGFGGDHEEGGGLGKKGKERGRWGVEGWGSARALSQGWMPFTCGSPVLRTEPGPGFKWDFGPSLSSE